jgi:hypothetical protein
MKQTLLFLFILTHLLIFKTTFAQTISDYYLPLSVGSHVTLYTPESGTWGARTTTYSIEGTDVISGKEYFREVGRETNSLQNIFQVFWMEKDAAGNIAIVAMSDHSTDVDSATSIAGNLMANELLTLGYSRRNSRGELTVRDSVESINETVTVTAGTFNNCLKISSTQFDVTGTVVFCEYSYYAKSIGLVKEQRTLPADQQHTAGLIEYGITGINNESMQPANFSLSQNYPNPFNPSTTINYSLEKEGNVKLSVYNAIGSKVATIVNENKPSGNYSVQFNGSNLSSGIYFYKLESGFNTAVKKFILMK